MTITSVSDVYSQASTTTSTNATVMGKDDFLSLLVAQLQNQDPLNPSDSTEFTAQLAQFSSLEQLQNINDTLAGFEVYQSTLNNIQSSGFIGKTVTASGDTLSVTNGMTDPISVELDRNCQTAYIQIYRKHYRRSGRGRSRKPGCRHAFHRLGWHRSVWCDRTRRQLYLFCHGCGCRWKQRLHHFLHYW